MQLTQQQQTEEIRLLKQQLYRERTARKKAEEMLRAKSIALLDSNHFLVNMAERLQFALLADNLILWEYVLIEDRFYQFENFEQGHSKVALAASYQDVLAVYHRDDRNRADSLWWQFIEGEEETFKFVAKRYFIEKDEYRKVSVHGKKVYSKQSGTLERIVGLFKDIHE
uniref:hypothetical protein n=1 Tax=Ningiella ruwaisensis TaxID=2364274 RepID=UPI0010A09E7D|nr:hypothetical protein [Ningiella ruwaisensis]